ncbi:Signal transduction histidine-protein kinase BarA [Marinomonas spartinae]|uniref:histidine kinase n=1 Tax=Marinomonas spartinae TaxID=1792290 RepID=A0A1A8TAV7_9GAMM|nr:response regulator [Marinomonas spartinae]SBS29733.1 Signal transduction histidine-protein kinase BarA [Marinomonas spartinae]
MLGSLTALQQMDSVKQPLIATLSVIDRLYSYSSAGLIFQDDCLLSNEQNKEDFLLLAQQIRHHFMVDRLAIEKIVEKESLPDFLQKASLIHFLTHSSLLIERVCVDNQVDALLCIVSLDASLSFDQTFFDSLSPILSILTGLLNNKPVDKPTPLLEKKDQGDISLAHNEHDYITLCNMSPDFLAAYDNDLKCVYANKAHERVFKKRSFDVVGLTVKELMGEGCYQFIEGRISDVMEGNESNFEYSSYHGFNKEKVTIKVKIVPRYIKNKQDGFYLFSQNITVLRRTQTTLRALHSVTNNESLSTDEKIQKMLAIGGEQYNLPLGIVSHVEGDKYTIQYCQSPNNELSTGMVFDLQETYCAYTLYSEEPTYFHNADESHIKSPSCYRYFALESYIGIVIKVGGEVWGTLSFSSSYPKDAPYEEDEIELIKLLGQWIGYEIYRSRALESLKDSECRNRLLLDSLQEGVLGLDSDGHISFANAAACRLTQYSQHELLGQHHHAFLHHTAPDGTPNLVEDCSVRNTLETGVSSHSDNEFIWGKQGAFAVEFSCVSLKRNDHEVDGAVITFQDKTKQIESEIVILEQKLLFESLFMDAPTAIAFYDNTRTIRMVNPAFLRLFGYSEEEVVGCSTRLLYAKEEDFVRLAQYYIRTYELSKVYLDYKDKYGRIFSSETFGSFLENTDGSLKGYIVHINDITERLQVEKEILTVNQRFSLAANSAGIGVWSWDTRTNEVIWDDWMWKIFGFNKNDDIDPFLGWLNSMHPDDAPLLYQSIGESYRKKENLDADFRIIRPDGQVRYIKATGIIECDKKGIISRITGVNFDITSRKEAEEVLKKASRQAQMANQAKSDFLATMSHEIRTPLNGILGVAELLKSSYLTDEQRMQVDILRESGESLLRLINDILDFSKIESGQLTMEKVEFDLEKKIFSVISLLLIKAEEKGVDLLVEYPVQMPRHFIGDSFRMRQILINLISNAVKFTHEGQVVVRVSCESSQQGNVNVSIEVRDTGIGIPDRAQASLFKAFTQADTSTTRRFGGTGLGLAITKQLVELMDGAIELESSEGVGSTFVVHVPLQENYALYKVEEGGLPLSLMGQSRILLVDDSASNLTILSNQLRELGMMCDVEQNASLAFDKWLDAYEGARPYDVIILDYQMPDLDGLDLCRLIRKRTNQLHSPAILISTSAGRFSQNDLTEAGVNVCLAKPLNARVLCEGLNLALNSTVLGRQFSYWDFSSNKALMSAASNEYVGRILIVEDMAANRVVARSMLKKLGVEIIEAENGELGVQKWDSEQPDLILMDLHMPVMDGLSAMRAIRQAEKGLMVKRVPIYALTADAMTERVSEVNRAGGDGLIAKPFKQADLEVVLLKHLLAKPISVVSAEAEKEPLDHLILAPRIDVDMLMELKSALGEDLQILIDTFYEDSLSIVNVLKKHRLSPDLDTIYSASHSMKSIAMNVGAKRLSGLAARLEVDSKRGGSDKTSELMDLIETEYNAFCSELKKLVGV